MNTQEREELICRHLDLVQCIVGRLAPDLPASVEREDLVSTGFLGLIKAVDRFDPGRGVKFETYASCLIRGEIMESLRQRDPAPRSLRRKAREMARVAAELSGHLRRAPRAEEVAEALGLTLFEYQDLLRRMRSATVLSLEESVESDPHLEVTAVAVEDEVGEGQTDPAESLERREFLRVVAAEMQRLPAREQAVLALYYGEDLTLREIGELFGITESRVCQLHAQALRRLKASLCHELQIAA